MKKNKIVFTGGNGRFGKIFRSYNKNKNFYFPTRKQLDITDLKKIDFYLRKIKPSYLIHAAALSRPMNVHEKNISRSIDTNILGTLNLVKICKKYKIKIIYFSSNYVYPAKSGLYREDNPVLPRNNYAWSKLGGEAAVHMYKNSLILRICMTEKPFIHKSAFANMITNFMFHEDLAKNLIKLIKFKGVINVGGISQSVYKFAKKDNPKIKKSFVKKSQIKLFPLSSSMNVGKFNKILKKNL